MSSTPSAGAPAPPAASAAAAAALPYSNGGRLRRVDTLDLKAKLAAALGANGRRYWTAFMDFVSARISRVEFEEEAQICLKPQHSEYTSRPGCGWRMDWLASTDELAGGCNGAMVADREHLRPRQYTFTTSSSLASYTTHPPMSQAPHPPSQAPLGSGPSEKIGRAHV